MPQKRMECFRLLLEHLAWIEYQFLSGIRDSRQAGSLWGMMRGVGGVRKSVHQSWLAKGLELVLGLLCWGLKGVQEDIPSVKVSIRKKSGNLWYAPRIFSENKTCFAACPKIYCRTLFNELAVSDFWRSSFGESAVNGRSLRLLNKRKFLPYISILVSSNILFFFIANTARFLCSYSLSIFWVYKLFLTHVNAC